MCTRKQGVTECRFSRSAAVVLVTGLIVLSGVVVSLGQVDVVEPRFRLSATGLVDTDDMCIWIHPTDTSLSTIIVSDKDTGKIVVFDLAGEVVQSMRLGSRAELGNIDVRYGFPLGDELVDIVAVNKRSTGTILVFKVDPDTRQLSEIDDGVVLGDDNYGMCLYKSADTGKFYAFATSEFNGVMQYELADNGQGQISLDLVRSWDQGYCEGAVADDELGYVYICEEATGIWRYNAEPDGPTTGTQIAAIGENGFEDDAEGVTIYFARGGGGYIIVSSQGNSSFLVFKRRPPHSFVKAFRISGVRETDGVDVTNVNLGSAFPSGLFVCHDGGKSAQPVVSAYEDLGLEIDTSYDPRTGR
jgi:3-phytase